MTNLSMTVEMKGARGLHLRPAAMIAKAATGFAADITVLFGGRRADAKSVLSLLTLGADQGAELQITAAGSDAHDALRAMEQLLASGLDQVWS